MRYLRRNFIGIIIFSLVLVMAYFSAKVIIGPPGMSVSGWIFTLFGVNR
jgi:hypothetical protein